MGDNQTLPEKNIEKKNSIAEEGNKNILPAAAPVSQDQTFELTAPSTIIAEQQIEANKSQTKTMEVHHHPNLHHRKKHWREYLLEFLMIFLAVMLGFFAESYREYLSDRSKEKEYVRSLIFDLKEDTSLIAKTNENNMHLIKGLGTLEQLLYSFKNDDSSVTECYKFFNWLSRDAAVNFNERTISQLLNSGNMRLIKQNVADSIIQYHNAITNIDFQKQEIQTNTIKTLDVSHSYFNYYYLTWDFNDDYSDIVQKNNVHPKMLNSDDLEIKKYAGLVSLQKVLTMVYLLDLKQLKFQATDLLSFLQKEYNLK